MNDLVTIIYNHKGAANEEVLLSLIIVLPNELKKWATNNSSVVHFLPDSLESLQ